ncbi:hypothetical protein ROLI_000600 [Roseobacter fucihabitans]|uniref:Uncharacterized protein n=1 Tax=Roseobacter fucihabitans TaxID=1537242 RepID=A0ABZ2BLH0_9RHOB|nr:hypothetical protein [Roseobacter litoralis]
MSWCWMHIFRGGERRAGMVAFVSLVVVRKQMPVLTLSLGGKVDWNTEPWSMPRLNLFKIC